MCKARKGSSAKRIARSSDSEFSIERKATEPRAPPDDLISNALFFWKGGADAHLAVERFSDFDGELWTNSLTSEAAMPQAAKLSQPGSIEIEQQTWFFAPSHKFTSSLSPYRGAVAEAAKFTRYGSAVIPSRCGTKLWSVDQISRADFFHYDASDCLSMPGASTFPTTPWCDSSAERSTLKKWSSCFNTVRQETGIFAARNSAMQNWPNLPTAMLAMPREGGSKSVRSSKVYARSSGTHVTM